MARASPAAWSKSWKTPTATAATTRRPTFLEGLPFPTGVMPWRNGVLVAAAPDIFYAEDTDGDGKADLRKVLFTGFNQGNQQHRVNGFECGFDGWIYGANGDSGGTVSVAHRENPAISGRDFRFRPDTGEFETERGQTQFGRHRDDWGNWFGNNNPTWLWHVTLPEHYLRRNPRLAVKRVLHVLANYDDSTRVFPASAPMVRPNQPWSLNHVTSGLQPELPIATICSGRISPPACSSASRCTTSVHREVLERAGAGFTSHRAAGEEQTRVSREHRQLVPADDAQDWARWRPLHRRHVSLCHRTSGVDLPEMQARLDLRAGADKGRIYRVVPEGKARRLIPNLAAKNTRELAEAMDSVNGWQRDTAQRLLVERADPSARESLNRLLTVAHAPQVRLQAMATLGVLGAITPENVITAFADPHPAVRCEALRQSEALAGTADVVRRRRRPGGGQ